MLPEVSSGEAEKLKPDHGFRGRLYLLVGLGPRRRQQQVEPRAPRHAALVRPRVPADVEPGSSLVTVRDPSSAQILARQHLDPSGAVTLSAPPGDYVVEVEGAGLQRSRAQVTVKEDAQFAFPVESSRVPVGLQYLLPQQEVMAAEIE